MVPVADQPKRGAANPRSHVEVDELALANEKMKRMKQKRRLSSTLTEQEFDNGYWYASELKVFAREIGVRSAHRLRKDQLEAIVRRFLRTGEIKEPRVVPGNSSVRDSDRGLRLELPVVHYVNDAQTKAFIVWEARKQDPTFKHRSGTRYLLNRWREDQLLKGNPITYGDLVHRALRLNETKDGPLRLDHARYINFISDFMAANRGVPRSRVLRAWEEAKGMDIPKTYEAWERSRCSGGERSGPDGVPE
jgi:hypothetical protein